MFIEERIRTLYAHPIHLRLAHRGDHGSGSNRRGVRVLTTSPLGIGESANFRGSQARIITPAWTTLYHRSVGDESGVGLHDAARSTGENSQGVSAFHHGGLISLRALGDRRPERLPHHCLRGQIFAFSERTCSVVLHPYPSHHFTRLHPARWPVVLLHSGLRPSLDKRPRLGLPKLTLCLA